MDPRAAPADSAEAGAPRPSHRLPRLRRGAGFITALLCVAALLVVGSLTLFVGLAVIFPVLGHATWHLYRKTVVLSPEQRANRQSL